MRLRPKASPDQGFQRLGTYVHKSLSLSHQLQIKNFGGIDQLKSALLALPGASGFADVKSIGIIRDADADSTAAFQSVKANLRNAGLVAPEEPEKLSCDAQPAVGVLILPGQGEPGMLETLLCKTFADAPEDHEDHCIDGCIDGFFQCVGQSRRGWNAKRPDKARAHAFIATKPDPHVSVGVAARKKYWNLDHPALTPVCDFLRSVVAAAKGLEGHAGLQEKCTTTNRIASDVGA